MKILFCVVCIMLFPSAADADIVYLKNGTSFETTQAWEEGTFVKCRRFGGVISYPGDSVERIEYRSPDKKKETGAHRGGTDQKREISDRDFWGSFRKAYENGNRLKMAELVIANPEEAERIREDLKGKVQKGLFTDKKLISVMGELLIEAEAEAYYNNSVKTLLKELAIAESGGDEKRIAALNADIGRLYLYQIGKHEKAVYYYGKALDIFMKMADRGEADYNCISPHRPFPSDSTLYRNVSEVIGAGSKYRNLGNFGMAVQYYLHALWWIKQCIRLQTGIAFEEDPGSEKSGTKRPEIRSSVTAGTPDDGSRKRRNRRAVSYELAKIVMMCRKENRKAGEAISALKKYLEDFRNRGDRRGEAEVLISIAQIHEILGGHDRVLSLQEKALAIFREIGERRAEGYCLYTIGNMYAALGQYDKAFASFDQALMIFRQFNDRAHEASLLMTAGKIYKSIGQTDNALSAFERVMALLRMSEYEQEPVSGKKGGPGSSVPPRYLEDFGDLCSFIGERKKAEFFRKKALAMYLEAEKSHAAYGFNGERINAIISLYADLGRYEEALPYAETALENADAIGNRGPALSLLGNICFQLKQYKRALFNYEQSLAIYRESGNRVEEALCQISIGHIHSKLRQYEKAVTAYSESLKIDSTLSLQLGALRWLAKAEADMGREEDAVVLYLSFLERIEEIREDISDSEARARFSGELSVVYDELIALLYRLHQEQPEKGYDRKSLEIFERKQGRVFLEQMGQSGAKIFSGIPEQTLSREKELHHTLSRLRRELMAENGKSTRDRDIRRIEALEDRTEIVKARQEILLERIREKFPDYYALRYPKPATLQELQKEILGPEEMMLIYGVMEEMTCLWAVSRDHFSLQSLPAGEAELAGRIERYRSRLLGTSDNDSKENGADPEAPVDSIDLYTLLFPLNIQMAAASSDIFYIVPSGPLYRLPFDALDTAINPEEPHYLIEDHPIAYLSSASLLGILRDAQAKKKENAPFPVLAFANPEYKTAPDAENSFRGLRRKSYRSLMNGGFTPLPETEYEVREITRILDAPDETRPLWLNQAASRSNLFSLNKEERLDDYRFLIFACHGILPGEVNRIDQPALILSDPDPETGDDGYLTMNDVFALSLNADLVTLSACNTGRGKAIKGEGVMGLTRAFMYAGTPAITVTLWSVESMSAAFFNIGFFRNLKDGKGRAAALRKTKVEMIRGEYRRKWRHPFYWAPTVVFGDGR